MLRVLSIPVFLLVVILPLSAQDQTSTIEYAIAIHGGAGSLPADDEAVQQRVQVLTTALDLGTRMLSEGRESLDVVEEVIRILEDSPAFNAGRGAVFNSAGTHELDASIMDGRDRSGGAVGGVRTVKNPISLARRVMTDTRHVLLATDGAETFADDYADDPRIQRVPNSYFSTARQLERLKAAQQKAQPADNDRMGTVGCVALDRHGNLAAGTSTGGLNNKKFGRIGDSPILSAGTFADNATCAVSCTGIGEDFIRNAVAFDVSARMQYRRDTLAAAVKDVLAQPKHRVRGGIIAVDREGTIVMHFNTSGMSRAAADSTGLREVHVGR